LPKTRTATPGCEAFGKIVSSVGDPGDGAAIRDANCARRAERETYCGSAGDEVNVRCSEDDQALDLLFPRPLRLQTQVQPVLHSFGPWHLEDRQIALTVVDFR